MARTVNPIRQMKLDEAMRKNNGDAKNSLLDAGYSSSTAERSTANTAVKISQRKILAELKARDIDGDWLLDRYLSAEILALKQKNPVAYTMVINSIAKYIVYQGREDASASSRTVNIINILDGATADRLTEMALNRNRI